MNLYRVLFLFTYPDDLGFMIMTFKNPFKVKTDRQTYRYRYL